VVIIVAVSRDIRTAIHGRAVINSAGVFIITVYFLIGTARISITVIISTFGIIITITRYIFTTGISTTRINGTLILIIAVYCGKDTFTAYTFFGCTFVVIKTVNNSMFTTFGILTPINGTGISIITFDLSLLTTLIRIAGIIETFAKTFTGFRDISLNTTFRRNTFYRVTFIYGFTNDIR
jgi:hypothetical protein